MDTSVVDFYDGLAPDYHLIFPDWPGPVFRQGAVLDRIIASELGPPPRTVLDCSCGIGTQAIGLALRGYVVHATDVSPGQIRRAEQEARALQTPLTFGIADFRSLTAQVSGVYDAVISCDNALPHLLSDEDLILTTHNIRAKLRADGLFLASTRDYDRLAEERPKSHLPSVFESPTGRRLVFQVWDWSDDGRSYVVNLFIIRQTPAGWATTHHATVYRALRRHELQAALKQGGFTDIRWRSPEETGYYQPIVTARAKAESRT
jgi:SAM-dependent methyltransferase